MSHSKYQDRPMSDKLRRRAEYMDSERAELIERISQTESLHRRRPAREGPARPGEGPGRSGEGPGRPPEEPRSRLGEEFGRLMPYEGWQQASSSSGSAAGMSHTLRGERSCGGTSQQAVGSLRSVSIHPQVRMAAQMDVAPWCCKWVGGWIGHL